MTKKSGRFSAAIAGSLAVICLAGSSVGATCTKQDARTALDALDWVCLFAHAESDDATIAKACAVEEALIPVVKKILGQHRAIVKAKASALPACSASASK